MSEPPEKANKALLEKGIRLAIWISFFPLVFLSCIYGQVALFYFQNGHHVEVMVSSPPKEPRWLVSILRIPESLFGGLFAVLWVCLSFLALTSLVVFPRTSWRVALRYLAPTVVAYALLHIDPFDAFAWWMD